MPWALVNMLNENRAGHDDNFMLLRSTLLMPIMARNIEEHEAEKFQPGVKPIILLQPVSNWPLLI